MLQKKRKNSLILAALLGVCAPVSAAAEAIISFSEEGVFDSNPLMRRGGDLDLYGSSTTVRLTGRDKTETSLAQASGWISQNLFNKSAYNSTDGHAQIDLKKKTPRTEAGLTIYGDYDTTRTSEIGESGLSTKMLRRTAVSVGPQISYNLSPLQVVGLSGNYQKVAYEGDSYTDFHTIVATPSFFTRMTPETRGGVTVRLREYRADSKTGKVVDSVGPMVGFDYQANETAEAFLHVGSEASRYEQAGIITQDWVWNFVFDAGLTLEGEQDIVKAMATRAQQAYSSGNDYLLTQFSVTEMHRLNPEWSLTLGANYQFTDADNNQVGDLEKAAGGQTGLSYQPFEALTIRANYAYKNESFVETGKVAQRHQGTVGLVYQWQASAVE